MQYIKEHAPAFICGALLILVLFSFWNVNKRIGKVETQIENINNNFIGSVAEVVRRISTGEIKLP